MRDYAIAREERQSGVGFYQGLNYQTLRPAAALQKNSVGDCVDRRAGAT